MVDRPRTLAPDPGIRLQPPALAAFLTGYALTQHHSVVLALATGWAAHLTVTAALQVTFRELRTAVR
ncbi:hypothetical protein GCM10027059_33820 [Myceligenerans halotolerans]